MQEKYNAESNGKELEMQTGFGRPLLRFTKEPIEVEYNLGGKCSAVV